MPETKPAPKPSPMQERMAETANAWASLCGLDVAIGYVPNGVSVEQFELAWVRLPEGGVAFQVKREPQFAGDDGWISAHYDTAREALRALIMEIVPYRFAFWRTEGIIQMPGDPPREQGTLAGSEEAS